MPGKVVRVLVAAGDEVQVRQGLVVVEAMKMQNEVRAPEGRQGRAPCSSVKARRSPRANPLAIIAWNWCYFLLEFVFMVCAQASSCSRALRT